MFDSIQLQWRVESAGELSEADNLTPTVCKQPHKDTALSEHSSLCTNSTVFGLRRSFCEFGNDAEMARIDV